MADETTEQYVLDIATTGTQQAVFNLDTVNHSLNTTLDQTQQLTAAAQSGAEQLAAMGVALSDVTVGGDTIASGITDPLTTGFDQADQSVQTLIHDIGDLGNDIRSLPNPDFGAFEGEGGGGDSGGGINPRALSTVGRLVGGPAGHALRAAGQVSRLADMLPEDTDALKELGEAGLIAAPAVIATVVALKDYTDQINAQKAALTGALSAEDKYYQALTTLTSGAAIKEIESTAQQVAALTTEKNELQGEIASTFSQLQGQFGDAGARALVAAGQTPITQLQTQLDSVNKTLTETTGYSARLQQGLDNDAFALNDAAAAATKHGALILKEADAEQQAQQLDSAARQKKIFEIGQEIEADQELLDAGQLTGLQSSDLTDKMRDLRAEQRGYADVVTSTADALEKATAATEANNKTLDLLTQEGDVRDKIANTEADIQQIREDAAAQQQADLTDEQSKIAEIQQSGAEKQQEILANNEEAKQKIQRQFALDDQTAIGNRDAYADEQARKKEALDLTNQQVSETKQLTAEAAAEQKSITQAQAAYEKSLTQQEQAEAKELAAKDRTLQQEQVDLQNILSGEIAITNSMFSQLETIYITHAQNIVNGQHALLDGAGNAAVLVPAPSSVDSAYPQAPLPAATGTAAQSHQHITVNVNGLVSDTAAAIVINHTMRQLDAMM